MVSNYTVHTAIPVPAECSITLRAEQPGQTTLLSSGNGIFNVAANGNVTLSGLVLAGPSGSASASLVTAQDNVHLQTVNCTFRDNDYAGEQSRLRCRAG